MLTLENMKRMWVHGDQHVPHLLEGTAAHSAEVFAKYGFVTSLSVAMAMGQFSEECGAGLEMEENLNYTEQRLLQVFPTHFTPGMAARAAHNPRLTADIAYGGRMGNKPPPSDDGWNYRGRGFSQVTGRNGYTALATKTGLDLLNHPELLSDPDFALECGVADLVVCGCLPFALKGDIVNMTKRLNGGYNGLADRRAWTARWRQELHI